MAFYPSLILSQTLECRQ